MQLLINAVISSNSRCMQSQPGLIQVHKKPRANNRDSSNGRPTRERERELRREGGKSLLADVKGVDPHLIHIDRPTTIRSPEHISGWVKYPPAYVIWVDGCVARTAGRGDVPYDGWKTNV